MADRIMKTGQLGYRVELFPDRIEVRDITRFGGFLNPRYTTIFLRTVTDVSASPMTNHVTVVTAGNAVKLRAYSPRKLRDAILAQMAELHSEEPRRRQRKEFGSSDPVLEIERLARLRDSGALSEDEFEDKKAELLERI